MLDFLNDEYIRSIKALNFINSSPRPVSIDEIADHIGIVRRTVGTLLTIIKNDSINCNFELQETTEKKYYLISKTAGKPIYLDDYLLICGKRSLLFSMTEELFNKGAIHTIQFCNDHYISQTTFSRGKKKLTELLERCQLKLTNYISDGIVGNEYQIRIFYFHFFNNFYHSSKESFKNKGVLEHMLDQEITKLFGVMTDYQRRKLHYLLDVIKKRTSQGHIVEPLSISFEYISKYEEIYQFMKKFLSVYGVLDPERVKNETHFFICCIYTQDIISLKKNYLRYLLEYAKDNSLHVEINNICIETFKKMGDSSLKSEEELVLQEELGKFHLSMDFLYYDPELFLLNDSKDKQATFNPAVYDFTVRFYQMLLKQEVYLKFRKGNLKNITDSFLVERYYYYIYYSMLTKKKPDPIFLFVEDSIEKIDRAILIEKLYLLFGEKIKFVESLNEKNTLTLTNSDTKKSDSEEVLIFSYNDKSNLKKVIYRIYEKIYEQLLD